MCFLFYLLRFFSFGSLILYSHNLPNKLFTNRTSMSKKNGKQNRDNRIIFMLDKSFYNIPITAFESCVIDGYSLSPVPIYVNKLPTSTCHLRPILSFPVRGIWQYDWLKSTCSIVQQRGHKLKNKINVSFSFFYILTFRLVFYEVQRNYSDH